MTTGCDLSGTTLSTRPATSMGGSSVAPARYPARHSCSSRVSSSAAPWAMSSAASWGETSRAGGLLIGGLPGDAVLDRVAQRLEREHGALHARRADLDAEVVENVLTAHLRDLGQRLALDLVGEHARR